MTGRGRRSNPTPGHHSSILESEREGLKQDRHDDGEGVNVILLLLVHVERRAELLVLVHDERRGELLAQSSSEYSDTLLSLQSGGEAGQGLYSVDLLRRGRVWPTSV